MNNKDGKNSQDKISQTKGAKKMKFDSLDQKFSLKLGKTSSRKSRDFGQGNLDRINTQSDLDQIKRELQKRDESRFERYMEGLSQKDDPIALRTDRHSPEFMIKLAQSTGDLEFLKTVQQHLDRKQERVLVENLEKAIQFHREMKTSKRTWSFLKRGFLGVDTFFIGFAILGLFAIPVYFIIKQRKRKEYMKKNGLGAFSVHDLDEYDELDVDDVSPHVTYYDTEEAKRRQSRMDNIKKQKAELYEVLDESDRRNKDRILGKMKKRYQEGSDLR